MIIAIDLDNTIWNLGEVAVDLFNRKYNQNVRWEDCHNYNLYEDFSKIVDITEQDIWDLYDMAASRVQFYDGVFEALCQVSRFSSLCFVTSSTLTTCVIKDSILKYYFYGTDVYNSKRLVRLKDKIHFVCDIMVDDYIPNLMGQSSYKIIFNQPYNQYYTYSNNWRRMYGWDEFPDMVKNIFEI